MKILKVLPLLCIFALLFTVESKAQDIHYSQFGLSPLTLNPAATGAFEGSFRIGGIYRDQWRSVLGQNRFATPSFYVDAPVLSIGKRNWLGVGGMILNDKAGTAGLNKFQGMLSLAYHMALGKKGNTYLSIGAQGGLVQKRIDNTKLLFEDQYTGGGEFNPSVSENFDGDNVSYPDFQAGISLNSYLSKNVGFNLGFAAFHLAEPNDAFLTSSGDGNKLPRRFTGHGGLNIDFGTRWLLAPSVMYQTQATASELNLQTYLGYHLNPAKDITFLVGGGYRLQDAVIAMLGMNIRNFKVGLAYDINTSQLNEVSGGNGGFELGLSYIAKIYKTPIVKPVLFCPRF